MTGYSGTPLAKKLGIKPGSRILPVDPPQDYTALVGPLPGDAVIVQRIADEPDIVHVFCTTRQRLRESLRELRKKLRDDGSIWVSWPKKSAKVASEITENTVRDLALPLGFVDIKVCAVDDVWSGLKLVVRREQRTKV